MQRPLVIAHRGASAYLPENTLPAFRDAWERFDADMVELDVRLSKDNIPVVLHDARLSRVSASSKFVHELSFAEISQLDAAYRFDPQGDGSYPFRGQGIRIPAFEEVLQAFAGRGFAVEIKEKSPFLVEETIRLLARYGSLKHSIVGSKIHDVYQFLKNSYPYVNRFCSRLSIFSLLLDQKQRKSGSIEDPLCVASLPPSYLGLHFDRQSFIDYLHSRNIRVFFWTVNKEDVVQSLVSLGANGIVSDDPGMVRQMLNRLHGTAATDG